MVVWSITRVEGDSWVSIEAQDLHQASTGGIEWCLQ